MSIPVLNSRTLGTASGAVAVPSSPAPGRVARRAKPQVTPSPADYAELQAVVVAKLAAGTLTHEYPAYQQFLVAKQARGQRT